MNEARPVIPVVLLAYARPDHLARVLACLRENAVPLIHAFADGAKGPKDAVFVAETRRLLRGVDWCELRLVEREKNLGLGRNVLAGVTDVSAHYEAFIVWEDDLVCAPGTYAWLCAALRHYATDERVMSVTAWTHPRVMPADAKGCAYFDARAESWIWGAWPRSWRGMNEETALQKMAAVKHRRIPVSVCGFDLPKMAREEQPENLWAVRWLYHHIQHDGLCLRPPWPMVDHIGFGVGATNAIVTAGLANTALREAPSLPAIWPETRECLKCRARWRSATIEARLGRFGRSLRRLQYLWQYRILKRPLPLH